MEIIYYDCLDSTQKFLVNLIKSQKVDKELAIVAKYQSQGIGSRNNKWIAKDGDILFSFAKKVDSLPSDLPQASASIYFAFLMKEVLNSFGCDCCLKWPNDIYIENKKCGGVITQIVKGYYIVGIGVNLTPREKNYAYCNIKIDVKKVLNSYFMLLKKSLTWQEIFSKFRLEFESNNNFTATIKGKRVSIKRATLCSDGALLVDNERIYSLR